jgi:formylmethanofuran dehydrogenase subunit E
MNSKRRWSFTAISVQQCLLGYRAAQAAMRALGVERAEDKELHVAETGKAMLRDAFWMA